MNSFDLNPIIQKEELPTKVFIAKPWPYDSFFAFSNFTRNFLGYVSASREWEP